MNRLDEINARLAAIATESETAEGEALAALEREAQELMTERDNLLRDIQARQALRSNIAAGLRPAAIVEPAAAADGAGDDAEARARRFVETGRTSVVSSEARAALISGGTLLTPTGVDGINESVGAKVSSILDLISVEDCEGMGSNKIAYVDTDAGAAAAQTEGQAPAAGTDHSGTYDFLTITPESVISLAYISKQAKKQTPLKYENKVRDNALLALRKSAVALVVNALQTSTLNTTLNAKLASSKGVIDEHTLRNIVFEYGGDEGIEGDAVLFLNKKDLVAFGDVRGTNEKKAIYEITPDGNNPNTGTIREGGVSVRYCIVSGLTACAGTSQSSTAAIKTMFYGNPKLIELDLFSNYEIKVSEDFQFDKLMDTIRGDLEAGAAVVAKNAFVAYTIAKGS